MRGTEKSLWTIHFLSYTIQTMKLDEKYDELLNAAKNEFQSRYNISDLFLSVNNFEDFFISLLEGDK